MLSNGLRLMDGWTPASAGGDEKSDPRVQVCIPNIDTAARRQRLAFGLIEIVVGLGILGGLLAVHADPLWRLPLLLVFWGGMVSVFQWRDHT